MNLPVSSRKNCSRHPEITKALTVLEESAFTDEELAGYEHFWDGTAWKEHSITALYVKASLLEKLKELPRGKPKVEPKGSQLEKPKALLKEKRRANTLLPPI